MTLKTGVMMLKHIIFHNISIFAVFFINKCSLGEQKILLIKTFER